MAILATAAVVLAAALPPGQCNEIDFARFTPREVRCVIRRVFPDFLEAEAIQVGTCESRLDPLAFNHSSGAGGVYQFLYSTWVASWNPYRKKSRFNTVTNVRAAKALYYHRDSNTSPLYGWSPWSCSPY